jgi:hypothetical protein
MQSRTSVSHAESALLIAGQITPFCARSGRRVGTRLATHNQLEFVVHVVTRVQAVEKFSQARMAMFVRLRLMCDTVAPRDA